MFKRHGAFEAEFACGPECSDSDATDPKKLPSLERKRAYLRHLPAISNKALLVTLADKVHNARSILGIIFRLAMRFGTGSTWARKIN
jgi:hypothetical protein